ncbi:MAG: putative enoyl-CoA hydratase [Gemmatimonadetes bacterium]|jgi:methylglutaconyl-CoA hydratase|nr:putative enoyl-CoA hydratase [Gemmatimonadota bacterium]
MITRPAVPGTAVAGGDVTVTLGDGIGTIRFGHPKGNSMPGALLQRLADAVTWVGRDPAARVIVLRSEGTGPFCAGASFDELLDIRDESSGEEFFSGFARVILAMIRAPKFVLVRVHGRTAGGGVGIAAAGDYTFAVRTASAKLSELAVGIGPFVVGPVIERRIGRGPYAAMAVDADWRDADWGERHALYARVYDDVATMDAAINALAGTLAASNPDAMALMKQVFWSGTDEWDDLLTQRARMSGRLVLSEFTRAAIAKFRERS